MTDEAPASTRGRHRADDLRPDDQATSETSTPGPETGGETGAETGGGQSSHRTLFSGTAWQVVSIALPLVVNIALTPYVIRGLGQDLYGIYLLCVMAQLVLATLDGGAGQGANRFFALAVGRGDRHAITDLLGSLVGVVVVLAGALYAVLWFVVPALVDFFPATQADRPGAVLLLRVMLALVAFTQIRGLFAQVLYVHNRFRLTSTTILAGHVVYAIGMVVTIQTGARLTGIAWTFVAQMALGTAVIVPAALRHLDVRGFRFVGAARLKEFFQYSWKVQITSAGEMLVLQADSFVVAKFAAPQLTPFGVGSSFAQTLRTILWSASIPMLAVVGRLVGAHEPEGAREEAESLQRTWVLIVCGWVAVGAPAAYVGVTHWLDLGTELPGLVAAMLLVSYGFALLTMVQNFWCLALGRPGLPVRAQIGNFALNIALTAALVGPFGAVGTVAATVVAEAVTSVVFVTLARRRLPVALRAPWREVPVVLLVAALAASLAVQLLLVGRLGTPELIPTGPVGLVLCGLASAPVLGVYAVLALGPSRAVTVLRSLVPGRG